MRVLHGRGNCRPGSRIEGLLRYAFIGDSTMYGAGVAPDQTLPAATERQMNELVPGWPVEAVNRGISGYNLWNSWLEFRHGAQVYDGVVLVLCNNDADLLSRAPVVDYQDAQDERWGAGHPFGRAVARCFDDMASFSREYSIPVVVIYSNIYSYPVQLHIGEIIDELCTARNLLYVDTFPIMRDRNFTHTDMVVSSADFHPSPMAHDAVARHLAARLQLEGYFDRFSGDSLGDAPERTLAAAQALVERDKYAPDIALNWALSVLEVKSRLARRMKALGGEDKFSAPSERVVDLLTGASRRWHMVQRVHAFNANVAQSGQGVLRSILCLDDEKPRLDEICFALGTGEWDPIAERSFDKVPAQAAPDADASEGRTFLKTCMAELLPVREALDGLRRLATPTSIRSPYDEEILAADLEILQGHVNRIEAGCQALQSAFERVEKTFNEMRPTLADGRVDQVSNLIAAALHRTRQAFAFLQPFLASVNGFGDKNVAPFSTIEITMNCEAIEGKPICIMTGQLEYLAPHRLPFSDNASFWPDGSTWVLRLRVPVFYAGRLTLRPFRSRVTHLPALDVILNKIEFYNRINQRRSIEPSAFCRDNSGRLVSPILYLP